MVPAHLDRSAYYAVGQEIFRDVNIAWLRQGASPFECTWFCAAETTCAGLDAGV